MPDVRYLPQDVRSPRHGPVYWISILVSGVITGTLISTELVSIGWLAIGGVVLLVGMFIWLIRRVYQFQGEATAAVAALGRGELEAVEGTFQRWTKWSPRLVETQARHNLAWTKLRQGDLATAHSLFMTNEDAMAKQPSRAMKALRATSAVDFALCYALEGDLDAGQQWLDEAERRKTPWTAATHAGMMAMAAAVLSARRGDADAERRLDERWSEYESELPGQLLRPLRVLRAFIRATSGPRDAGVIDAEVRALAPTFSREYVFLATGWPEMQQFLVTHQLLVKPAA